MEQAVATRPANGASPAPAIIESVIAAGDLGKLSPAQRSRYYLETCRSLGLNPLTRPFEYITLNGKLTLYARKDATDQLRSQRAVSLAVVSRETVGDVCVVTVRATLPDGRVDEEIGAVSVAGLRGDALANAWMKAITKGKRRVTLSICGLGMLDESEAETIPGARIVQGEDAALPPGEAEHAPEVDAADVARQEEQSADWREIAAAPPANDEERRALLLRGISQLVDEIVNANPRIKPSPPKDDAPIAELESWLAEKRSAWSRHAENPANKAKAKE